MRHPPQEADAISGRFIARIALGVVVTMACALVVAFLLGGSHRQPIPTVRPDINGIETSTFATEAQGLAEHHDEEQRLSSYGWVDRDKRVIHVPISVAFDLWLAQHGGPR
jgi:hypothetical protein